MNKLWNFVQANKAWSILIGSLVAIFMFSNGYVFLVATLTLLVSGGYQMRKFFQTQSSSNSGNQSNQAVYQGTMLGRFIGGVFVWILLALGITYVTGIGVWLVVDAGSVPALLTSQGAMSPAVFASVVALLAGFCGFYLWWSGRNPKRWLYFVVMVCCLIFLGFWKASNVIPLPEELKTATVVRLEHLRAALSLRGGSSVKQMASNLSLDAAEINLSSAMPRSRELALVGWLMKSAEATDNATIQVVSYDVNAGASITSDRFDLADGKEVPVGTLVYYDPLRAVQDTQTGLIYVFTSLSDRSYGYMLWSTVMHNPDSVKLPSPIESLSEMKAEDVAKFASLESDNQIPWSQYKSNFVTIDDQEWYDTAVVLEPDHKIKIGTLDEYGNLVGFNTPEEVANIFARVGGRPFRRLIPISIHDGRYIGQVVLPVGARNPDRAPVELKAEFGIFTVALEKYHVNN